MAAFLFGKTPMSDRVAAVSNQLPIAMNAGHHLRASGWLIFHQI
jgi:hypothetical protein